MTVITTICVGSCSNTTSTDLPARAFRYRWRCGWVGNPVLSGACSTSMTSSSDTSRSAIRVSACSSNATDWQPSTSSLMTRLIAIFGSLVSSEATALETTAREYEQGHEVTSGAVAQDGNISTLVAFVIRLTGLKSWNSTSVTISPSAVRRLAWRNHEPFPLPGSGQTPYFESANGNQFGKVRKASCSASSRLLNWGPSSIRS